MVMKNNHKLIILGIISIIILIIAGFFLIENKKKITSPQETTPTVQPSGFFIISSTFMENQKIPLKYTCDGENVHPPLTVGNIPKNTKSLALIVDDIDTPSGSFVHWIFWNMLPETKDIPEGKLPPEVIVGKNGFGNYDYGGPCPPSGEHRYAFRLYALDTVLVLEKNVGKQTFIDSVNGHVLGQTEYTGVYSRD